MARHSRDRHHRAEACTQTIVALIRGNRASADYRASRARGEGAATAVVPGSRPRFDRVAEAAHLARRLPHIDLLPARLSTTVTAAPLEAVGFLRIISSPEIV